MWEQLLARANAGIAPVRLRIEEMCLARGLHFPWWVPPLAMFGGLGVVVVALIQRDALWPPGWLALTLILVALPHLVQFALRVWIPSWLEGALTIAVTAWLVATPPDAVTDVAPVLLMVAVAEAASTGGLVVGAGIGVAALAALEAFTFGGWLEDPVIYVIGVFLGFMVGVMLRAQMRALVAEQAARSGERDRATLAERQRIAREIHDLVAHSLSVTLLHITGARHALRDGDGLAEEDRRDVDDALADAERVGREAMAEIRRTVSTLADDDSSGAASDLRALPTAADVPRLVEQIRSAGLDVEYDERGDLATLAPAAGLGLYRILQESLANVARHATGSTARVLVAVEPARVRLVISNRVLPDSPRPDGTGRGVAGIKARAAQLGATALAGRRGDDWVVEVRLPLTGRSADPACAVVRMVGEARA